MLFAYLMLVSATFFAPAVSQEERRAVSCSNDDLLKVMNYAQNSADARRFCSSYLHIPIQTYTVSPQKNVTVTAVTTSTRIATVLVTRGGSSTVQVVRTTTISPPSATTIQVTKTSSPIISTQIISTTLTTLINTNVTITSTITTYLGAPALQTTVSLPKFLTSTYAPSRISSACSCVPISSNKFKDFDSFHDCYEDNYTDPFYQHKNINFLITRKFAKNQIIDIDN
ncbi:hypothetical protein PVAG01_11462 [Phlyctema vagabunda]|uniref:Uncharacterized protein n=1 Tax=Phlyctema vagabunda TaxID=108571 RepID=A0ABR4P2E1_9HELO